MSGSILRRKTAGRLETSTLDNPPATASIPVLPILEDRGAQAPSPFHLYRRTMTAGIPKIRFRA